MSHITKQHIEDLHRFMISMRAGGTTTLIAKQLAPNDAIVIVAREESVDFFDKKRAFSLPNLAEAYGLSAKPVFLDNHTVLVMCESMLSEINRLEDKAQRIEEENEDLKAQLNDAENRAEAEAERRIEEVAELVAELNSRR